MASKRLTVVIGSLNIGGTERHLLRVLPRLREEYGWKITIFTLGHPGTLAYKFRQAGIKVKSATFSLKLRKIPIIGRYLRLFFVTIYMTVNMLMYRDNIINFFLPSAYIVGGICAVLTRHKKLVISRRSVNRYQKKFPFIQSIERVLHKNMDYLVGNCEKICDQLREESSNNNKIICIYNGIEMPLIESMEQKNEIRKSLQISENSIIIINLANLRTLKGHEDLFVALNLIKNKLPEDWTLLLVGYDKGILNDLQDYAKQLGLYDHIKWLSTRDDVYKLLFASDISVLCSHFEGFSNSILESMATGLPQIATDTGGNSEAVINGETGIIIPTNDPEKLSQAILTLASNPTLREQYGKAARKRAEELFNLEKCVKQYNSLYALLAQ